MALGEDVGVWIKDNVVAFVFICIAAFLLLMAIVSRKWRTGITQVLATVYLWVAFWGSHSVCFVMQGILLILLGWWMPRNSVDIILARCQQMTIFFLINVNPFWWVSVVKRPKGGIPRSAILMPNHLSYVDSWIVAAAVFPVPPIYVAMGALFKMPLFGQVMRLSGHIPVNFYKKEDGKWGVKNSEELMQRAKTGLENGRRLCVFPEGAMSRTQHLLPFKDGFFRLAMEKNRPIVPIGCWGNHLMFPPGNQFSLAGFATVKVAIGEAVYPSDFGSVEELREAVQERVRQLRNGLPNFNLLERDGPEMSSKKDIEAVGTKLQHVSTNSTDLDIVDLDRDEEPEL